MKKNKFTITEKNRIVKHNKIKLMILIIVLSFSTIFAQSITSVSPNSAVQGETDITVTFTISADTLQLPPAEAPVGEAKIGTLLGTSLVHVNETTITGVFSIPFNEEVGTKDVSVTFIPPPDQGESLVFALTDGFTVNKMADTAPNITSQPKSKDVQLGSLVTFSVDVYGSQPFTYQWQKNDVNIDGATSESYSINGVTESDAGSYKCVVTNDFGSAASDEAILSIADKTYEGTFPIVDTDQTTFYDTMSVISAPSVGEAFYGQDAQYYGNQQSYTDNGDGTVTDNVTGLMWQQSFDHNGDGSIDVGDKLSYDDIISMVEEGVTFAGYSDWRLPSIKEQYSLMAFSGFDISNLGLETTDTTGLVPFINNKVFEFNYGDTDNMERLIDVQCATTDVYVADESMVFGVNFADGRIKGYGMTMNGQPKKFNYLLVRDNIDYGINSFEDNGDGTVSDKATGLMWMQDDNGEAIDWEEALNYAENFEYAGYSDWRLPNIKELNSILDYSRSPATTNSAAIDPTLNTSEILNEAGEKDYPWYWSGTTHAASGDENQGGWGAYMSFGRCMGNMGTDTWTDVHGAGAQRSDPKASAADADYSEGHGPQGDAIRGYNYVRLVRGDGDATEPKSDLGYNIIETGQETCYDANGDVIDFPSAGEAFFGQDAQFDGTQFSFEVNDGIVTDNNTGLMWQQIPTSQDFTWQDAVDYCESLELGGYDDWRMPSLKELFSISNFNTGWPYLDLDYFNLATEEISKDEQYWSSNYYVGTTVEGGSNAAFGVNHVTGHIKAYSANAMGPVGGKYVRAVRGGEYGVNNFEDNEDGTITDAATGLMWAQDDDGVTLDWENALAYAENSELANYSDWRLPNVKELQSIVDYSYSPSATIAENVGPAIDPIFSCTPIKNEADNDDYGYYWTNTSASFTKGEPYYYAWYVAFGMAVNDEGQDFHGAGGVRFDTKVEGGPLGEGGERYYNFIRLVRNVDGNLTSVEDIETSNLEVPTKYELLQNYPNPFNPSTQITVSIPESGNYSLKIYNILGQEVATLLNDQITSGTHTFNFDASQLTSGIYFYNFSGNNFSQTKKMILMK